MAALSHVEVWRGSTVESIHRVSVAVVDAGGRLRAGSGAPEQVTVARSAVKPIQALPLVTDGVADRYGFGDRELALCSASHSGEAWHVEGVRRMLDRIGVDEAALACGPHAPFHPPAAAALTRAGEAPGRVHNNCSGKHAGMLAIACFHGWPIAGYHRAEHPVQQRMLEEVARWTDVPADDIATGVDGCGVVTFGVPLDRLAGAFARLGAAAWKGGNGATRIVDAMRRCPEYVGGTDRLCTDLMRAVDGRVIAKTGAEGVYCAAVPGAGLGIALKVEDGARRASEPALIGVLRMLGLLMDEEVERLSRYAEPEIRNTRGESVGRVRAMIELEAADAGSAGTKRAAEERDVR